MSISGEKLAGPGRVEQASVRLQQPQRKQVVMVVTCPDDLVSASHPVSLLLAVAERLDLKQFYEPIQARQGVAGRDATDPQLLVALWLYACTCGIGSARLNWVIAGRADRLFVRLFVLRGRGRADMQEPDVIMGGFNNEAQPLTEQEYLIKCLISKI